MPTCESVAAALASRTRKVTNEGRYRNRKGTLGNYARVKSGERWYMVLVSDMLQSHHKQWWLEGVS